MEKTILYFSLSVFFIFSSGPSSAQWDTDTLTFEDSDTVNRFSLDTMTGCWQRGIPSKTYFNATWSGSKAMITDTLNFYPAGANDYFEITFRADNFPSDRFLFHYKTDCDSLSDGGWIETYDYSSAQWINIYNGYTSTHTFFPFFILPYNNEVSQLSNGEVGFSGNSQGWKTAGFDFCGMVLFGEEVNRGGNFGNFKFRFRFMSDSINNNREGWMIDDIQWDNSFNMCPGSIIKHPFDEKITVYPNPSENAIIFESPLDFERLEIYDISNRVLFSETFSRIKKKRMDISALPDGIFFYRAYTPDNEIINGKFIKTKLN